MRQTEEEHSGSTGAYALPKFNYFTYNMIFFPSRSDELYWFFAIHSFLEWLLWNFTQIHIDWKWAFRLPSALNFSTPTRWNKKNVFFNTNSGYRTRHQSQYSTAHTIFFLLSFVRIFNYIIHSSGCYSFHSTLASLEVAENPFK